MGEIFHVLLRPKRAVGADHRVNARLGRVTHHAAQFFMDQRLASYKKQVANVIPHRNIDDIPGLLQCDAAPLFWVKTVHCEAAEIAFGVADVSDGKLEIPRPAMSQHLADQPGETFPWPFNRT